MKAENDCDFVPWPEETAARYREKGLWTGCCLHSAFDELADRRPESPALICGQRRICYRQLQSDSRTLAHILEQSGLRAGDYVVVQMPNCAEFFVLILALFRVGVIPVLALIRHRDQEIASYIEQTRAKAYFGPGTHEGYDFSSMLAGMADRTPSIEAIYQLSGTDAGSPRATGGGPEMRCLTPVGIGDNREPIQEFNRAEKVALLQLSGGSTGTPKLIPRTHDDYLFSVRQSIAVCGIGPDTRQLAVLPLAHNFTLSSPGALGVLFSGGCVVIAPTPLAADAFSLIARESVDCVALVPALARLWVTAARQNSKHRQQLRSLTRVQVGGAPLDCDTAKSIEAVLECELQQVYGMAEGLVCYTRPGAPAEIRFSTQGFPMSTHDEVRIVDRTGQPVAIGDSGELQTRGPYTIRGYFRAAAHNRRAFTSDGFYRTGDIARLRADGHVEVRGRIKEQINRAGEKIATPELEALLLGHPEIREVAVVGIEDRFLGEKSLAVVVTRDGARLSVKSLRRFTADQGIAEYKIPDGFVFRSHLPLSAVGKVDKVRLRAELESPS